MGGHLQVIAGPDMGRAFPLENGQTMLIVILANALEGMHAKQVTRPGQLVGALAYVAPDRAREDLAIDTRSDSKDLEQAAKYNGVAL